MIKRIAPTILAASFALPTVAAECDQEEAQARWTQAEEHQIILGVGMVNDVPSFAVDTATWEQASLTTRTGMAATFECIVAGPDSSLRKAHVLNNGGKVLAVWDGVSKQLDIK